MKFKKILWTKKKPATIESDEIYLRFNHINYTVYYRGKYSIKCKRVPTYEIKKILRLSSIEEQIKEINKKFISINYKNIYMFHLVSGENFTGYIDEKKRIRVPMLDPSFVDEKMIKKYSTLPSSDDSGWEDITIKKPPRFRKILTLTKRKNIHYGYYNPEATHIKAWRYYGNGMASHG